MSGENQDKVSNAANDLRRAIDSLREEMEAVNFYTQRAELCTDEELKKILLHNGK